MQGFEITLDHGRGFTIPSMNDDFQMFGVQHDCEMPHAPWILISQERDTEEWARQASYDDLDTALAMAVKCSTGATSEFKIKLPCGRHVMRPGRVPVEQVLQSMGWLYVHDVTGFLSYVCIGPVNDMGARRHFLSLLSSLPHLRLGEVYMDAHCQETNRVAWIADVHISFEGFVLSSDIENEKDATFSSESIELVQGFDFKARECRTAPCAEIVDLDWHRSNRMKQAA
jgi:hypothetical protein